MNAVSAPAAGTVLSGLENVVESPRLNTLSQAFSVKSSVSATDTEAVNFDELVSQYLKTAKDQGGSEEQLEALKTSMEEMDDSEVYGFLAMLQTQSEWSPVAESSEASAQLMTTQPDSQGRSILSDVLSQTGSGEAVQKDMTEVLDRAVNGYMPINGATSDTNGKDAFYSQYSKLFNKDSAKGSPVELLVSQSEQSSQLQTAESQKNHQEFIAMKMADPSAHKTIDLQSHSRIEGVVLSDTSPEAQPLPVRVAAETVRIQAVNDVRMPNIQTTVIRQDVSADRNWSDAIGQRLVTMLSEGRQEARIRLDPPELGTMGVRLVIQSHGVSVQFSSDIPQVREMLDGQADRLRMAMDQQGMNLVDVNVGRDHSEQQGQKGGVSNPELALYSADESVDLEETIELPVVLNDSSLINTFA